MKALDIKTGDLLALRTNHVRVLNQNGRVPYLTGIVREYFLFEAKTVYIMTAENLKYAVLSNGEITLKIKGELEVNLVDRLKASSLESKPTLIRGRSID